MEDRVIINHQDGRCIYKVRNIDIVFYDGLMDVEIETDPNEDCVLGFLPPPSLYIENAKTSVSSLKDISSEKLKVSNGWDENGEEKENGVYRIYIGQHTSLDNNILSLTRLNETEIKIIWHCDAIDFNYYDERSKRNLIEINAVYKFG